MGYMLAVDTGGSKCDAVLVTEDGEVLAWGYCDVNSPESGRSPWGAGRSRESVESAVKQVMHGRQIDNLRVVGISGRDLGLGDVMTELVSEPDSAFALAGVEYGVIALAGTGAAVTVCNRSGEYSRFDGLGPFIGDHGSGYAIGLAALRAAAQSSRHPRHRTSLAPRVFRACLGDDEAQGASGLVMFAANSKDRAEFAALARIVDEEACAGDAIAITILQRQAEELSGTVYDAVQTTDLQREECPLLGIGGVIASSDIYWNHLVSLVSDFAPNLKPIRLQLPPVLGVALAAMKRTNPDTIAAFREQLLANAKKYLGEHKPRRSTEK